VTLFSLLQIFITIPSLWPLFRQAATLRLNRFGSRTGTLHARLARRDYGVHPLLEGALLCSRKDCILNLEKQEHDKLTNRSSINTRMINASAVGSSGSGGRGSDRVGKHGRYPTSSLAVDTLLRALDSQGFGVGGGIEKKGEVRQGRAIISVADICGTPLDQICVNFSGRTDVLVYANDLHPPPTIPKLAESQSPSTLFTRLDASSESFPKDFLQATSSHSRQQSNGQVDSIVLPDASSGPAEKIDYIITSPPYGDIALPILHNALSLASVLVAMKLPLNFLCPGRTLTDRRQFLAQHPPSSIIPMCQADNSELYSTRTDEAWFIWLISSPCPSKDVKNNSIAPFIFSYKEQESLE
jgi:hypothetical protein